MDEGGPLRSLVLGEFNPVANWGKWNVAISSELVRVEVMRAVERLHVMQQITNDAFAELSRFWHSCVLCR